MPKKIERGDSLVSPGMVCYAEKQVKPFWSNSLGQMVQFDTIIFCRTFKNYFGQFVWIEKKSHYYSRVSLHEAPTKNIRSHKESRERLLHGPAATSGRISGRHKNTNLIRANQILYSTQSSTQGVFDHSLRIVIL